MSYLAVKHLHLAAVGIALALLLVQAFRLSIGTGTARNRWLRGFVLTDYAALLAAGIGLIALSRLVPTQQPWLLAKIAGFVALVTIDALILPRLSSPRARLALLTASLALFVWIIAVALTRSTLPGIGA